MNKERRMFVTLTDNHDKLCTQEITKQIEVDTVVCKRKDH